MLASVGTLVSLHISFPLVVTITVTKAKLGGVTFILQMRKWKHNVQQWSLLCCFSLIGTHTHFQIFDLVTKEDYSEAP